MKRRGDGDGSGRAHEQPRAGAPVWDDGSGRLRVGRSQRDADAALDALGTIRPADADGSDPVFGLSAPSIARRIRAAAANAGLGSGFSGHSGRVGMARRMAATGAPTHRPRCRHHLVLLYLPSKSRVWRTGVPGD